MHLHSSFLLVTARFLLAFFSFLQVVLEFVVEVFARSAGTRFATAERCRQQTHYIYNKKCQKIRKIVRRLGLSLTAECKNNLLPPAAHKMASK